MRISNEVLEDILNEVSSLETKGDAVIIEALKIPRDIFQKGGRERSDYKAYIQRQIQEEHFIHSVFVLWTADGDCCQEKPV